MIFSWSLLNAQCTPADSVGCPDPENNGEICPDSMAVAIYGIAYSEVVTILAPPVYMYLGNPVPINKIVLNDVSNLPPGITFATNAAASTFYPGTRYCILMSGTPSATGTYTLKIKVGVYITFLGNPVYVGEQVDSTSLSMIVLPATSIDEQDRSLTSQVSLQPNPFDHQTSIGFYSQHQQQAVLEVINLLGEVVCRESMVAVPGRNKFLFDGSSLKPGVYQTNVFIGDARLNGKLVKAKH